MRSLSAALLLLALAACGTDDDDDGSPAVSTTTTASDPCPGGDPALPPAADGSPAEVVAATGNLRLAIVDRGASVEVVSVFRLDGCDVRQVEVGGQPVAFPVGGTVTHGDGIRCRGDRLVVLSASSDDGETYQATTVTYEVEGTALSEVDRAASTIEAGEDPETLRAYYSLDC